MELARWDVGIKEDAEAAAKRTAILRKLVEGSKWEAETSASDVIVDLYKQLLKEISAANNIEDHPSLRSQLQLVNSISGGISGRTTQYYAVVSLFLSIMHKVDGKPFSQKALIVDIGCGTGWWLIKSVQIMQLFTKTVAFGIG